MTSVGSSPAAPGADPVTPVHGGGPSQTQLSTQQKLNEWEELITASEFDQTDADADLALVQVSAKELMKYWSRPKAAAGIQETDIDLIGLSPAIKTVWRRTCTTLRRVEEVRMIAKGGVKKPPESVAGAAHPFPPAPPQPSAFRDQQERQTKSLLGNETSALAVANDLGNHQTDVPTRLAAAGLGRIAHELQAEYAVFDTLWTFTNQALQATPPRLPFCFVNFYDVTILPEWLSMTDRGGRNMLDETEDGTLLDGEDEFVNKLARAMNREHCKSNKTFQHFTQFC